MALPQINTARYEVFVPGLNKEVKFRPYLVKEEKVLMLALESGDQKQIINAVKNVIEACTDDVEVDKLAIFDVELLFLHLRSKSVGEGINVSVKCTECSTENPVEVNIDEIEIPEITDDRTVMITDNVGLTMRYPSFRDVQKFKPEELEKVDGIMELLSLCIENIFDDDNVHEASDLSKKELDDFVGQLSNVQFAKVSTFFEGMPALKHTLEFECQHCKAKNSHELRGIQSFFT